MPGAPIRRLVEIAGRCELGLVRTRNEDTILVADLDAQRKLNLDVPQESRGERGPLLIVCDGMGGVAGDDVASQLASKVIYQAMRKAVRGDNRAVLARSLRRALRQANQEISAAGAADKRLRGMGTTVSAAAFVGNTAVLAQVGDSRAYVLRNDTLTQITRDQSVVSALVQAGKLSEEQAPYSMQRGRILQALGSDTDVEVSLSIAELRAGDRLLLCSDGLHGQVSDDEIRLALGAGSIDEAAASLVRLANAAGGDDNVSVIIARVSGQAFSEASPDDELRFTEIDHAETGLSALSSTSLVGRRLAHKAGIRDDPWPKTIPSTSQHPVVRQPLGLAERTLAESSRLSRRHYLAIACVVVAGLLYLLTWQ